MPYAAKATIRHELIATTLNIYIEFFHPMEMYIRPLGELPYTPQKPSNDLWIIELDSVVTEITTSEWLDQYTMLLTIEDVASLPGQVLVTFDGPSTLLTTAWEKQWEPWSLIPSIEGWPQNFKTGMIILWSGSIVTIPTGWHLCDGTVGTPDLRNRFVVGAGDTYNPANTGGEATHVLSIAEMPIHHHHIYHNSNLGGPYLVTQGGFPASSTFATIDAGGDTAHENRPPYYALCYIMKL